MDLGGFRGRPTLTIARQSPAPTLGCTPETGSVLSGLCVPAQLPPLCARFRLIDPSNRSRSSQHSPTPPEVSSPSGDVTAGVRSTRAYHTRHLPPLTFLRSATAYSSNGSPVIFRTGTTYGFQRTRTSAAPLAALSGLPSRTLPSWIARLGRAESRRTTAWLHQQTRSDTPTPDEGGLLRTRPASPRKMPASRRSRDRRTATTSKNPAPDTRTLRTDVDLSLTTRIASNPSRRRAHRLARNAQSYHKRQTPLPAATAPLPERQHAPARLEKWADTTFAATPRHTPRTMTRKTL